MTNTQSSNKSAVDAPRGNIFMIKPEQLTLIYDEKHPLYDERVNDDIPESMIQSVMVLGILEPIIARKNGPLVEVVDGKHRVKAALEANERMKTDSEVFQLMGGKPVQVPTIIKKESDARLFNILISANEIRQDDSPMNKSEKARRLQAFGYTVQDIAKAFGVSRQSVDNWLSLQDLDPKLQEGIENGEIPATAAKALAKFDRKEQVERFNDLKEKVENENKAKGGRGRPAKITGDTARAAAKSKDNVIGPKMRKAHEVKQELRDTPPIDEGSRRYRDALIWVLGYTPTTQEEADEICKPEAPKMSLNDAVAQISGQNAATA